MKIKPFEKRKEKLLKKLNSLMNEYDEFTNQVSPKHWRTTGTHFAQLRTIESEVNDFTEISEEQRAEIAASYEANSH